MSVSYRKTVAVFAAVMAALLLVSTTATTAYAYAWNNIKGTVQYEGLKNYVTVLEGKVGSTHSAQTIANYKSRLAAHRMKADDKVRVLYQQQLNVAKDHRSASQAHLKSLKKAEVKEVNGLKSASAYRVSQLKADKVDAANSINAKYASQTKPVSKALKKAQRKLAKTTNPATRSALQLQIDNYENELDDFARAQKAALANSADHYDSLMSSVRKSYKNKIMSTKSSYETQIATERADMQTRFAAEKQSAQLRRSDNFAAVAAEYGKGFDYISKMVPSS